MGRPAELPIHLSHTSALVLLPPTTITPPIETVRRVHDKHFARWPPHINLIYPFLASPADAASGEQQGESSKLKQDIYDRIKSVTKSIEPIHIRLSTTGTFHHGKKSKTVWLDPVPLTGALKPLQNALQKEFSECDADQRPFTPHLSVGQANSDKGAQNLGDKIRKSIRDHLSRQSSDGEGSPEAVLDWHVDEIYVIERKGYHGRFNIVGAIKLGEE